MRRRTAAAIEANRERAEIKDAMKAAGKLAKLSPEESRAKRLANLKPWKPGQSGNPSGVRKNDTSRAIAQAIFDENQVAVYKAMGKALLKGNAYAFEKLAERGFGKLTDKVHHSGSIGGDQGESRFAKLSDADLKTLCDIMDKSKGKTDEDFAAEKRMNELGGKFASGNLLSIPEREELVRLQKRTNWKTRVEREQDGDIRN